MYSLNVEYLIGSLTEHDEDDYKRVMREAKCTQTLSEVTGKSLVKSHMYAHMHSPMYNAHTHAHTHAHLQASPHSIHIVGHCMEDHESCL